MSLLSTDYILAMFLILVRVSSLLMTAPFFNSAAFPRRIKIFFALITSFILSFIIPQQTVLGPIQPELPFVVTAIILEALVGIAMGLVGQLIFAGIEMAGRLISLKITLTFARVVNVMTQQQSDLIGNTFTLFATFIFLKMGGEKIYLDGLVKSFEVIPVTQVELQQAGPFMLEVANYLFVIAAQIASPFLMVIFIVDLSLAIFARVMPQANIMFIALPIKLGLGFVLLSWMIPFLPGAFKGIFQNLFDYLVQVLKVISP